MGTPQEFRAIMRSRLRGRKHFSIDIDKKWDKSSRMKK